MPDAAIGSPERVAANLVTSENLGAFNAKRLDLAQPEPPKAPEPPKVVEPQKEAPKVEPPKTEPQPEQLELDEVIAEGQKPNADEAKKERFRGRISELTNKRKEAEAKAEAAEKARQAAEKEAAELRTKIAPPPPAPGPDAPKAAPQRAAFATDEEYQNARIDHAVETRLAEKAKAEAEARQQAERARTAQTYLERATALKTEVPDFDAKIEAKKDLPIPSYIGAAILESEVGPRIALHFADHPEEAARLANLQPNAALREFGKIEAMIETQRKAPATAAAAKPAHAVEVSAAPPPISPIQGRSQAVDTHVDSSGVFTGTYKEWKDLRKKGKV